MIRLSDSSNKTMICRVLDLDDLYETVPSGKLDMRQAHLLLAGVGGFVVEYQGKTLRLDRGESIEMPSMAEYVVVSAEIGPRTPRIIQTLAEAARQAAAFATAGHPDGETFVADPIAPAGARLLVLARRAKG